ncbi:MAG: alpha/beta hydrolase [Pseudomonadota bacterium]
MNMVFGQYDQEALDAQYNLRARVPTHQTFFDAWAADSQAAAEQTSCTRDIRYGAGDKQLLDLFVPEGTGRFPIVLFIHGGYWQALSKDDYLFPAPSFVNSGIAFASVGYDLCPDVSLDALVEEVRGAIDWTYHHARDFHLDRRRIYVAGHSAGGHLTAMMMSTNWTQRGMPLDVVKGGCSISGIYDLEPLRLSYQNELLRLTPEAVARLSPANHVPSTSGPLIAAVGGEETDEFIRQQADYAAAWRGRGLPMVEVDCPDQNHFEIVNLLKDSESALMRAVRGMVGISQPG